MNEQTQNSNAGNQAATEEGPVKIELPPRCRVTEEVILQLDVLLDFAPPRELKDDLLHVLLHYLMHEGDMLDSDFKHIAENYLMLFDWLDTVEHEMAKRGF
jgi:hypothetical protein